MNSQTKSSDVLLWVTLLGLLLFALHPALTRSHLEGFTYQSETMSLLLPDTASVDPLWSLNAEFFYLTRPGVVWAMAPFSALSPGNGYILLMWAVMPVFLLGFVVTAQAWSRASWLASAAALLFIPLAVELNFFTNDNILAASISLWGIAVLLRTERLPWVGVAGALLCFALVCRLDQLLLLPLFLGLAVLKAADLRGAVMRVLVLCLGFACANALVALADPSAANLFLRIDVANAGDALWERGEQSLLSLMQRDSIRALIAFGAALPVILIGAVTVVQRAKSESSNAKTRVEAWRAWLWALLLLSYPALIYIPTVGKYYDPRGFTTMLPMLAALAAVGIDRAILGPIRNASNNGGSPNTRQYARALVLTLPVFLPALHIQGLRESAPPVAFGRIWHGATWQSWQDAFRYGETRADGLIELAQSDPRPSAVMSWYWTQDRQFQNALAKADFRPVPNQSPACAGIAETYAHADGTVVSHLRLHVPFLQNASSNSAALFANYGEDCLASFDLDLRFSLGGKGEVLPWGDIDYAIETGTSGWDMLTDADITSLVSSSSLYTSNARVELDVQKLDQIGRTTKRTFQF